MHGPTLLSLDAVVVGLSWQHAFAEAAQWPLGWHHRLLLAAPIWMFWTWDRVVDAWLMDPIAPMTSRHRFARKHASGLLVGIAVVLCGSLALAVWRLTWLEWLCGLALVAASGLYFLRVAMASLGRGAQVYKAAGLMVMFSAAVTLFIWANAAWVGRLFAPLVAFCALVWANVLVISVRERHVDALLGQPSPVQGRGRVGRGVQTLPVVVALFSVAALGLSGTDPGLWIALAGAGVLTALLAYFAPRLPMDPVRTLADAALAAPPIAIAIAAVA